MIDANYLSTVNSNSTKFQICVQMKLLTNNDYYTHNAILFASFS